MTDEQLSGMEAEASELAENMYRDDDCGWVAGTENAVKAIRAALEDK